MTRIDKNAFKYGIVIIIKVVVFDETAIYYTIAQIHAPAQGILTLPSLFFVLPCKEAP